MTQPIKQIVEEFEKRLRGKAPMLPTEPWMFMQRIVMKKAMEKEIQEELNFLTTSLTQLIEGDIEWCEEQRISYLKSEEGTSHGDYGKGYNQALSDIITYKRSQLSNNN